MKSQTILPETINTFIHSTQPTAPTSWTCTETKQLLCPCEILKHGKFLVGCYAYKCNLYHNGDKWKVMAEDNSSELINQYLCCQWGGTATISSSDCDVKGQGLWQKPPNRLPHCTSLTNRATAAALLTGQTAHSYCRFQKKNYFLDS